MTDSLQVHHNPVPAAERVARWHGVLRSRLALLVLSLILSVVIFFWQRQSFNGLGLAILIFWNLVPLVWCVVAIVYGQIAKRDLAAVGDGVAMTVSRTGISMGGLDLPWAQVASLAAKNRGPGRSPLLVLTSTSGEQRTLAMEYLDVLPSQIDDALRAWTSGRVGLDLSATGV